MLALDLSPDVGKAASPSQTMADAAKLVQEQKYTEAIGVYDAIIKAGAGPAVPEAKYRKGLCLKAQQQYPAAVACWEDLLKTGFANPCQEDALLEMAKTCAFDLNQTEPALKLYERFFNKFPSSKRLMEARYQECGVYYRQGNHEQAKARFERFLKEYPDSYLTAEVRKMIALCDEKLKLAAVPEAPEPKQKPTVSPRSSGKPIEDPAAKLNAAVEEAEESFKAGKYEAALKAYQDIRKKFSSSEKDELALFRIGQCHAKQGQEDKALAAWGEVVAKSRGKPESEYADDSLLAMGDLYLQTRGEPDKALEYYRTLIATAPDSEFIPQAEHQLGLIYFYQGQMNEALVIFEKERKLTPQDTNTPPDSLTRLIEACKGERSYVPDKTETAQGRRAGAQIRRGDVYFTAKDYEKAKKAYEEAVRLVPGTEEAAYALMQAARCHTQLRQYRQALDCYEEFLGKYQASRCAGDALIRMAVIHISRLDNESAGRKVLETIIKDHPKFKAAERAMYYLATLDFWDKRWTKAREEHLALMRKYPNTEYIPYITNTILPEIEKHTKEDANDSDKKASENHFKTSGNLFK